jgi:hypothetical protein
MIMVLIAADVFIALSVVLATNASAKTYIPKKEHACKTGYRQETISRRERKHHRIVRVKVRECVSVPKVKPITAAPPVSAAPAPTPPTTPPTAPTITAHLDPSFTQDSTNPLEVTYSYSASASSQLTDAQPVQVNLPAGILNLYSNGLLECSMNVGGLTAGGSCEVTYASYGTQSVVVTYESGSTSATDTETEDIEPPTPPTPLATTTVLSVDPNSVAPNFTFDASVTDANGPVAPPAGHVQFESTTLTGLGAGTGNYEPIWTATTRTDGQSSCTLTETSGVLTSPDCALSFPSSFPLPDLDGSMVVAVFQATTIDWFSASNSAQYP